jgi:hypothetical protein
VERQQQAGRNVFHGDPTDCDFWERVAPGSREKEKEKINLALLAMPKFTANRTATQLMIEFGYRGIIAAGARFDDEVAALKEAGVHAAYNFFNEAGTGLAEHVFEIIEEQPSSAI